MSVSERIDSCLGLVRKASAHVYNGLSAVNRRWIDPEDVLQEGLLAAVQAEHSYRDDMGAKYSTYLCTGLRYHLSKVFWTPLAQKKRIVRGLVELDAPAAEECSVVEIPATGADQEAELAAAEEIVRLLRRLSAMAAGVLIGGLMFHRVANWRRSQAAMDEIRAAVRSTGMQPIVLSLLQKNPEVRKMALKLLVHAGRVGLGTETMELKILECVECKAMMPLKALGDGRYDVDTMTCGACFRRMRRDKTLCFGRRQNGHVGFSAADVECRLHCADRKACERYLKMSELEQVEQEEKNVLDGIDFSDIEEEAAADPATDGEAVKTDAKKKKSKAVKVDKPAKAAKAAKPKAEKPAKASKPKAEKTTKQVKAKGKKAKAEKPAKAEKVAKGKGKKAAAKADKPAKAAKPKTVKADADGVPPADVGPRWPFRSGTVMRFCFVSAYEGIELKDFNKGLKSTGHDPKFFLRILRSEGKIYRLKQTHSWKLNEEGGVLKVYDVKYVGE